MSVTPTPHHEQVARILLEAGAAVNQADEAGATALMIACQNGHDEVRAAVWLFHKYRLFLAKSLSPLSPIFSQLSHPYRIISPLFDLPNIAIIAINALQSPQKSPRGAPRGLARFLNS